MWSALEYVRAMTVGTQDLDGTRSIGVRIESDAEGTPGAFAQLQQLNVFYVKIILI